MICQYMYHNVWSIIGKRYRPNHDIIKFNRWKTHKKSLVSVFCHFLCNHDSIIMSLQTLLHSRHALTVKITVLLTLSTWSRCVIIRFKKACECDMPQVIQLQTQTDLSSNFYFRFHQWILYIWTVGFLLVVLTSRLQC